MRELHSTPFAAFDDCLASRTPISVLIIGAGTSGIAVARELDVFGIDYLILESLPYVGGIWSREPHSACYPALQQNTAPNLTVFDPPAVRFELRGTHFTRDEYAAYLVDYASHCGIAGRVKFNVCVTSIITNNQPLQINVSSETGQHLGQVRAEHVIYAGGLHNRACIPDIPTISSFAGDLRHSSEVGDLADYRQQRVLLVGVGNTSADLAVSINSAACSDLHLSRRGPVWVVPREIGGMQIDAYYQALRGQFRKDWAVRFYEACVDSGARYFGSGDRARRVDFRQSRITVSTALLHLLNTGQATVCAGITDIEGAYVSFEDRARAPFESIILCTGYDYAPIRGSESKRPLIGNVRNPEHPIWYIGAPAVWGGSPRLAQYQGQLVARAIFKKWSAAQLQSVICKSRFRDYQRSAPTVGPGFEVVDFFEYRRLVNDVCENNE